jgi:hypothetical protein
MEVQDILLFILFVYFRASVRKSGGKTDNWFGYQLLDSSRKNTLKDEQNNSGGMCFRGSTVPLLHFGQYCPVTSVQTINMVQSLAQSGHYFWITFPWTRLTDKAEQYLFSLVNEEWILLCIWHELWNIFKYFTSRLFSRSLILRGSGLEELAVNPDIGRLAFNCGADSRRRRSCRSVSTIGSECRRDKW